jgi:hypothetical protein
MRTALLVLLCALSACASLNTARPLDPGLHEVGATLGGGMTYLGSAPIPLPNVMVEARSGVARPLGRPLEVSYGLNLTALPFGILQTQVGAAWLLAHQKGGVPAVSMAHKIWFATNAFGANYKTDRSLEGWGNWQVEFDVSWKVKEQLVYLGLAQYTDFAHPSLTLTPALGATFDTDPQRPGGFRLQLESRWYGVTQSKQLDTVRWVGGPRGAFGVSLGVSYVLGKAR